MDYNLTHLLQALVEQGASDLHISAWSPPRLRLDGKILPLDIPPAEPAETERLCYSILTDEQRKEFESSNEMDLSFSIKNLARFRANVYKQKSTIGGTFRVIPTIIKTLEELKIPSVIKTMCEYPRGMILVTGATGSGKSTTLASMVDYINSNFQKHIITIEEPIEFVHNHKKSLITQREVGGDTHTFGKALKSVLRQDPDVVMVGELRDLETISMALTAAETGHLVFGTLHTNSCVSSISRLVDVFPPHQQDQVRTQLSFVLRGVLSQLLVPSQQGGRVLAMEIMAPNNAIRSLIRENKIHAIYSSMQIGQDVSGMQTMNQSLAALATRRIVSLDDAIGLSSDRDELETMLEKTVKGFRRARK